MTRQVIGSLQSVFDANNTFGCSARVSCVPESIISETMAHFEAHITITLRPSILDPQGKATSHALDQLGFDAIEDVRIGKHIRLGIEAESRDAAHATATRACEQLLANPVMEDFRIDVREAEVESN